MNIIYKKHKTEDGELIAYYVNGKFQKYVNPDKPAYLEWLKKHKPEVVDYKKPKVTVSTEELRNKIYSAINKKTSEKILAGIKIKNVNFKLDDRRQADFQALYLRKDDLTYPFLIWEGMQEVEINSADEMSDICESIFDFIYTQRYAGKQLKNSVSVMSKKDLLKWSDPR